MYCIAYTAYTAFTVCTDNGDAGANCCIGDDNGDDNGDDYDVGTAVTDSNSDDDDDDDVAAAAAATAFYAPETQ